jgi:hypothetical protein
MNRREGEAVDTVAVGEGDGLEVYHLEETHPPGEADGQVGQNPLGLLEDPVKAGEMRE